MPDGRSRREGEGLEFERVWFFTDAVFAIAFTLLIVEVGLPEIREGLDADDPRNMLDALVDKVPVIVAFVIGCFAIGGYWMANRRFVARIAAVDGRFVFLVVIYLMFVAFLPFSVGTLGEFFDNPISVAVFAVNIAFVSTMEAVLLGYAWRHDLLEERDPAEVHKWSMQMSIAPVALFLLSIPVAFIASWLGVLVWLGSIPLQAFLGRRKPAGADRYLE